MATTRQETFDEVAELYDHARPGYPEALFDTLLSETGLTTDDPLLEIGSGTGKATLPFAQRGYAVHCLEPGRNLAAVAAQNLSAYPRVTMETVRFEDWPVQEQQYGLVFSAQAFHWIPTEVAYAHSAQALKAGGWMALFWNLSFDLNEELHQELDVAYRTCAPVLMRGQQQEPMEIRARARGEEIVRSGFFEPPSIHTFPWSTTYTTSQYLDLLSTYSDHRLMPQANRDALYNAISALIHRHGGQITWNYAAVLYLARKR